MFARALAAPGLRAASIRAAPRAIPRAAPRVATTSLIARRNTSTTKKELDNNVRRGWDEIVPFLKRLPVDVYPLVAFVSFVCCLGVFFSAKTLLTDKTLRLKPAHMEEDASA